jgi:hypothetical protein
MVQPDGSLMVIDPKKFYTKQRDFPRHLVKGFLKLGVLNYFLDVVREERPHLYKKWVKNINEYVAQLKSVDSDSE